MRVFFDVFGNIKKIYSQSSSLSTKAPVFTRNQPHMLALEPRIVFDGAIVATASEALDNSDQNQESADTQESQAIAINQDDLASGASGSTELVFIDMRLSDAEILAENINPNAHIIWIDPAKDGVAQIGQALDSYETVSAVHVLTHAEDGALRLGNTLITAETLGDSSDGLSAWSDHLTQNADILFYGCNLAESANGQTLINDIANLTGADIAASTDLTGASQFGGDWALEHQTGQIEAAIAVTSAGQVNWNQVMMAVPTATIGAIDTPLIGDTITFDVTFDNSSATDTGYAPYINLFLPFLGADGVYDAATDTYTDTTDGVTFVSATFLGQAVTQTEVILEDLDAGAAGIQIEHPFAQDTDGSQLQITIDDALGFQEGDKLHILTLPFGSFTPDQPTATIEITATVSNLADVGTALPIVANAGFQLGNDALDNFDTDAPIQATTINAGTANISAVTPQLFRVNSNFTGAENETATGENFNRGMQVSVDIASGQTLDNLEIDYQLSEDTIFTGSTGGTLITTPAQNMAGMAADDIATIDLGNGAAGTQNATFNFYVAEFDQSGANVLDPSTGVSKTISDTNNIIVRGDWTAIDVRDQVGGMPVAVSDTSDAQSFTAKSIAIQKGASNSDASPTPGDTVTYTLNFQISDYFAFDTLTLEDTFDDGLNIGASPITLDVTRQGTTETQQTFTLNTDYTLTENTGTDYSETLNFDISALLTTAFANGTLEGGKYAADDLGATTGAIVFDAVIQDTYADPALGASNFIKQADVLTNRAAISGNNIDGPAIVTDGSSASVTVPSNPLSVSVYETSGASTSQITPGDDVTYRLRYELVTGDFEDFTARAFLPLPIFNLADPDADGGAETFTLAAGGPSATSPGVGEFRFGPDTSAFINTNAPLAPGDVTVDTVSNSISFDLGDLDDPANAGGVIDILFTIRASADPFADGLFLTTLGEQSDDNTAGDAAISANLVQIELQEPDIETIIKGVVATNVTGATTFTPAFANGTPSGIKAAGNGDANPLSGAVTSANLDSLNLDNDVSDVDAGDLVRFAIIVENTGSSANGAFDVTISEDAIPAGFEIPAGGINLRAVNGAGTILTIDTASPETALFTAGGIRLTDPGGGMGVLADGGQTDGTNIAIITYDLEVADTAEIASDITSEARLTNYSNIEGGDDFTSVDLSDDATTTIAGAEITKTLTAGSEAVGALTDVVIGEVVTYETVITIPEGTSNLASFRDTLDTGLAFLDATNVTITPSAGISLGSSTISFSPSAVGETQNRQLDIDFGTITNTNNTNTTDDTITITYQAVVLNTDGNDAGDTLDETARYTSDNEGDITATADDLTIREPSVSVTVTPDNANADASDTITWTVVVTAAAGTGANAYDVDLTDVIPSGLTYVGSSLSNTGGAVPTSLNEAGGTITANWANLTPGQTSTFTFQTTVDNAVSLGQAITNTADIEWSSLSGTGNADIAGTQSTFDSERDGSDGEAGTPDNYAASGDGDVTILFNAPVLSVDSTSEASNGGDATVGEIVRYRFVVRVPESTTNDFIVRPDIPTGMQFLNDGTATIAFVSDGGLSSDSGTLTGGALAITGDETTVGTDEPTFVINGANINAGANGSGDDVSFELGMITNADNDGDQEFIIIEYNALVLNETGVDGGDTFGSTAEILSDTTSLVTSNNVDVDIVEPAITNLVKSVTDTDGTTATYTITFQNSSGSSAFDVNLADSIPANLTNLSVQSITPLGGTSGITDNTAGSAVDIDISTMPDGGSVTIVYTADIVDPTANVADTDATVTWTSVPGNASTLGTSTAGTAGSGTGERTGSGVGENDYTLNDGAGLSVISGTLYEDINQDDVIDGTDPKLQNTQINLTYLGADNMLGGGDDITLTTLTGMNGEYNFGALPSGMYQISVQPSGMANGLPANYLSLFDATGSDTDNLIELTLAEGGTNNTANFGVLSPNSAPSFANLGGGSPDVMHTEDGTATILDADATLIDPELGTNALDDWDGATLTITREGGANAFDVFSNSGGTLGALTQGGNITLGGVNKGTVTTNSGGTLVMTFGNDATTADVNAIMQQIAYSYGGDAPPASVTMAYTVNDGNSGNAQGTGGALSDNTGRVIVALTNTNDLPTGADNTVSIIEDGSHTFAASQFGFSDPDNPDSFQQLRIDMLPPNGTLELNGTPITVTGTTIAVADIPNLVYTPDPDGNGVGFDNFTFSVGDNFGGFDAAPNTFTFDVSAVNDDPSFGGLGGSNPDITHVEGAGATALDPDATLIDPELNAADNWNGATLTLLRNGGANADDGFATVGPDLAALTEGNPLIVGATTIGAVTTNSGGQLVLTFNGNATNALVNQAMQQIGYEFAGDMPPASVAIQYIINDGNTGVQGTGGALSDNTGLVNVAITATNDAPAGTDNTLNLNEDDTYTFTAADFGYTDPDVVDTFTNLRIDTVPANGELQLNGVTVAAGQIIPVANIPNLVFVPITHESGNNYGNFTFSVGDQSGLPNAFDPTPNTMTINLAPVSDGPDIDAPVVSTLPGEAVQIDIDVSLIDVDGSEVLDNTVTIDNIPLGVEVFGPGMTPIPVVGGSVTLTLADLADLTFAPSDDVQGTFNLTITAGSTDGAAPLWQNTQNLSFQVRSPAQLPILPPSSGNVPGTGVSGSTSGFGVTAKGGAAGEGGIPESYRQSSGFVTPNVNFENDTFRDIAKVDIYMTGTIDDKLMIINEDNVIQISKSIFRHSNSGEQLTYEVETADGSPLPNWIDFDDEKFTFTGVPPQGAPTTLEFVITARDSEGNEAKATFKIIIIRDSEVENAAPVIEGQEQNTSEESNNPEDKKNDQNEEQKDGSLKLEKETEFANVEDGKMGSERLNFEDQIAQNSRFAQLAEDTKFINSL